MPWKYKSKDVIVGNSWTTDDGITHPSNWSSVWTDDDKKSVGMEWVEEVDNSFDGRFYSAKGVELPLDDADVVDNDGNKVKDADGNVLVNKGLKTMWIENTKNTAMSLLTKTDWYVVRNAEGKGTIPSSIADYRQSIRASCDKIEKSISDAKTMTAFKKLFVQPKDGNAPIEDWPKETA